MKGLLKELFPIYLILLLPHVSLQKSLTFDNSACNPPMDATRDQYIIGYGSLMESASKSRTYENTGENLPVLISGYRREWNCKGVSSSLSTTYLGVVPSRDGALNGVIFKVPNKDTTALEAYDDRELYYCREEVPEKMITLLISSSDQTQADLPKGSQYWIYVTKPQYVAYPSEDFPIVQSYVDVFLSGCLEMQKKHNLYEFGLDCLRTTDGWNYHWINDRLFPRRPLIFQPNAGKIDKLLAKELSIPNYFKAIQVQ